MFTFHAERDRVADFLRSLSEQRIGFSDLQTRESSLEDIFVGLVHGGAA